MERDDILCSADELGSLVEAGDVTVLDCRFNLMNAGEGREAYRQGHIPGAVYVHLDDDLATPVTPESGRHPMPSPEESASIFRGRGVSSDRPVVVYDAHNGAFAARAWWMLRWLGHADTRLLEGGLKAWCAEDRPLEAGDVRCEPGDFSGLAEEGWLVTTQDIVKGLAHPLVDARSSARFSGREEPIDTVAGHVPGAVNLPFDLTVDGDGRFLAQEQLAKIWVDRTGNDDSVTVMCGSGVTACHLALSALLAGRSMPSLYAGSWSEWIRDESRPVASEQG